MKTKKTAIILGATGLTGSLVLHNLLKDDRYEKIKLFTRKHVGRKDSKIEEILLNLFELENLADLFTGDEVYCCVGSTRKKTPDLEVYRMVDFGIPATAARLCKRNKIKTFTVISSMGANENSRFFYNRVKGEMEGAVLEQQISNTYILRPSLIGGEREESRPLELFWKKLMKLGDNLLTGKLRKYQSIHPEFIARAMIYLSNNKFPKNIIESDEIKDIAIQNENTP